MHLSGHQSHVEQSVPERQRERESKVTSIDRGDVTETANLPTIFRCHQGSTCGLALVVAGPLSIDSAGVCSFDVPCHSNLSCAFDLPRLPVLPNRHLIGPLLPLQRLLLTFQDLPSLPSVSSHHNTALSPTHPLSSPNPTQLPRAENKTCRDSPAFTFQHTYPPQHWTLPQSSLHHYSPRSHTRRSQLATTRPTQSPPPPLVRPDDRRIVYFITAR
jgi:hypothetical protein